MKNYKIIEPDLQPKPKYIFIKDNNGIKRKISIIEAEAMFGVEWLEWDIKKAFFANNRAYSAVDFNNAIEKIEIDYMDTTLGWGLFARKKLFQGDYIGLFTGKVSIESIYKKIISKYAFNYPIDDNKRMVIIDATTTGNFIRFIQHLPTNKDIEIYEFNSPEIINDIAVANIHMEYVFLKNGLTTVGFFASRNINIGEIIGCSYVGWPSVKDHKLLNKYDGSIVKAKYYRRKN